MGYTFYGKNGKTIDRNIAAGDYLAKITLGLWDKIGCYPRSKEDCKLVARILKNRVHLDQYYDPYWKEKYNVEKMTNNEKEFDLELAEFFETCGGCYSVDEFYDKFPMEEREL